MTPFQQFRFWARRAPAGERALAAFGALTLFALLAWAAVPAGGGSSSNVATSSPGGVTAAQSAGGSGRTAQGSATGIAAASGPGTSSVSSSATSAGAGPANGSVSGSAGAEQAGGGQTTSAPTSRGPSGTSSAGCAQGATDQGVTATQVHIGVVLLNIEGQAGNSVFGYPAPSEQQAFYQALIDSINKSGGVQCRQLQATYYQANALDPSQEHATCLQMLQDHLFAAISIGFYQPPSQDCPSANKIPTFLSVPLAPPELDQYYPYLFTVNSNWQQLILNYVMASKELGWFAGSGKVGVLELDCQPELNTYMLDDLARIGTPSSNIVTYDYGCPSGLVPPNQVEEAVIQFKLDGVTHVIDNNTISLNYFSRDAQQQDYKPKYGVPDGVAIIGYREGLSPDPTNFNGALAITPNQWGALHTPGVPLSPATDTCNAIMTAAKLPTVQESGDASAGIACDGMWALTAAMAHDASLTRTGLAAGLDQTGQLPMSYPQGPADFSGSRIATGGEYWRPDVYDGSCSCFKVANPTFAPSFS